MPSREAAGRRWLGWSRTRGAQEVSPATLGWWCSPLGRQQAAEGSSHQQAGARTGWWQAVRWASHPAAGLGLGRWPQGARLFESLHAGGLQAATAASRLLRTRRLQWQVLWIALAALVGLCRQSYLTEAGGISLSGLFIGILCFVLLQKFKLSVPKVIGIAAALGLVCFGVF